MAFFSIAPISFWPVFVTVFWWPFFYSPDFILAQFCHSLWGPFLIRGFIPTLWWPNVCWAPSGTRYSRAWSGASLTEPVLPGLIPVPPEINSGPPGLDLGAFWLEPILPGLIPVFPGLIRCFSDLSWASGSSLLLLPGLLFYFQAPSAHQVPSILLLCIRQFKVHLLDGHLFSGWRIGIQLLCIQQPRRGYLMFRASMIWSMRFSSIWSTFSKSSLLESLSLTLK